MPSYLVRRPGIAANAYELDAALMRLRADAEQAGAAQAQWLHSYAVLEADGRLGLACVFRADSDALLRQHAAATRLPAAEIVALAQTLMGRPFAPSLVYLVRRRRAWAAAPDFERSAALARRVAAEQMPSQVVWLHSHVVREDDGTLGSVCLYQAVDAQVLAEHAARCAIPVEAITPVIGRIVFRNETLSPPARWPDGASVWENNPKGLFKDWNPKASCN